MKNLPILTFHDLDGEPSVLSFPSGVFREGMSDLHRRGFRSIGLEEAAGFLRDKVPFPERSFVITFDDGYRNVYRKAFPVLRELGMEATVFLAVGDKSSPVDTDRLPPRCGREMLSWGEAAELSGAGWTIGAHTLTHPDLTLLGGDRVEREVRGSRDVIEQTLGVGVATFAYPGGRFGRESRDVVRRHFSCACSDRLGLVSAESDPHALERVDAWYLRRRLFLDLMGTARFSGYVAARSLPRRLRRWIAERTS